MSGFPVCCGSECHPFVSLSNASNELFPGLTKLLLCSGLGVKWAACLGEPITAKCKQLIGRSLWVSACVVVGTGGIIETIWSGSNFWILLENSYNFTSRF